jgi:hypothetical protein
MKEIISQYGKALLSGVAMLMVFGLLFLQNSPLGFKTKLKTGAESIADTKLQETKADIKTPKAKPVITSRENLKIENTYSAKELINGDGITCVKLISIMDDEEKVVDELKKGNEVFFKKPGIYRVSLYVEDAEGRFGTEDLYIGVGE